MARTTIIVIRHGDRYDYDAGSAVWKERCRRHCLEPSDPPLSALGHAQAREVAAYVASRDRIDQIIVSPYLRALQTAQPLAHATGLPLCVDFAVAESHQKPCAIPAIATRLAFLPEISENYEAIMNTVVVDVEGKEPGVEPRLEHLRRMLLVARELPLRFAGQTVAIVTHAATLALISALMGAPTLESAGKFAPCGVFKLVSDDGGATWSLAERGDDNTAHIKSNGLNTMPWGFAGSNCPLTETEELWQEALRVGSTDLTALCPVESVSAKTVLGQQGFYDPN